MDNFSYSWLYKCLRLARKRAYTTETAGTVLSGKVNTRTELFLRGLDTWWKNLPRKAWQVSVPLLLPLPCSGATVCTKAYGVTLMRNRKEEGGPRTNAKKKRSCTHELHRGKRGRRRQA